MGFLTVKERDFVRDLINGGILKLFCKQDFQKITKNGGVGFFCGDGDIDVYNYHRETVTKRSHSIQLFGGPLLFSKSFEAYNEAFVVGTLINMGWGMKGKDTRSVFLYPHYPCAVASNFNIGIQKVIDMSSEVHKRFSREFSFPEEKVHSFFHVKRMNKGGTEEQNTYLFYPELI